MNALMALNHCKNTSQLGIKVVAKQFWMQKTIEDVPFKAEYIHWMGFSI